MCITLLHSTVWLPPNILLPLGPNSLFTFSFFPFTSIFLFHFHFTVTLCLPFPSLYYSPIYSPYPSLVPPPPFLYHSDTSSCLPLLSTNTLHSPLTISVLPNCSLFWYPSFLRLFLCPLVHLISLLDLPALHMVIYHEEALDYDIYPSSLLSLSIHYQLLYWFLLILLCSSLLIYFLSPLSLPFTQLYSLLYPGLHGIVTML